MNAQEIKHMVIFNLKYEKASAEAEKFLEDGRRILSSIPVVQDFEVFSQVSPKNDYDFGFSMKFANKEAYESYNNDPRHVDFVKSRWEKEVVKFLEIDFKTT